jgi:transcriptional regulator with XRE-family HTH domain
METSRPPGAAERRRPAPARGGTAAPRRTARKRRRNDIDLHVATRLKEERLRAGLSQQQLAATAGVSFQQVQKYENGSNRVSAGRLAQFARALNLPIEAFFQSGEDDTAVASVEGSPHGSRLVIELIRAFNAVEDPDKRRAIVTFVKALARPSR